MAEPTKPADAGFTTARAGQAASTKDGVVAKNAKVFHLPTPEGEVSHPCIRYNGDAPDVGKELTCILDNGVMYSGMVADVIKDEHEDGAVVVSFKDGLTPVKK